jgi:hypothetical protein
VWEVGESAVGHDILVLLRMASLADFSSCSLRTRVSSPPPPRLAAPPALPPTLRISPPCSRFVACSATMPQVQPHEIAAVANAAAADAEASAPGPPTTDIYAGISTIPISAALIGSGVNANELNGDVCSLTDRPNKKQVQLQPLHFFTFNFSKKFRFFRSFIFFIFSNF